MEIKFKKKLSTYDYLLMFDLASKVSGICLFDLRHHTARFTRVLKVTGELDLPSAELAQKLDRFFLSLKEEGYDLSKILVAKEAMPVQLRGGSSTVQTFIAMARSHAVLDNYLYEHNIDTYDYVGVYPISTHAYYKKLTNAPADTKVTKEGIRDLVLKLYPDLNIITLDESDAVFLAKTLIDVKWNKDLDEAIREQKRHRKTLKAPHAIAAVDEKIKALAEMKI